MVLVLSAALGAFLVGRLAGGNLPRLLSVRPRSARLLVVTLALQVAGWLLATLFAPGYWFAAALSGIFVAVFGARNRWLPGVPLVALGLLCNVAVVVANGAMPVASPAADRAGVERASLDLRDGAPREELTGSTRLRLLAERVPVALPPHREVASPGDVMVAAGVALYVVTGMNRTRRRVRTEGPQDGRPTRSRPAVPQEVAATYATM